MKRPWLLIALAIILGLVWLLPLVDAGVRSRLLPVSAIVVFGVFVGIVNPGRVTDGDSPEGDDIWPSVGGVVLAGGLFFLGVTGAAYYMGALRGAAALPVAVVAGCLTVAGLAALASRFRPRS